MTYCVIFGCSMPHNPDNHRVCQYCGSKLLLKERYRPIKPIGQGGFGRTFLAIDEDIPSKPSCVVKQLCLLNPTPQNYAKAMQLFQQEAVRLDELGKHPQIPSLLAHFEQNRLLYLVQELVEGQTLSQEVEQRGAFTEHQITELLKDLLPTLAFIHEHNIIHRDIKPSNIIRRSQDQKLILIDFGIAKVISETTALKTGTIIGTAEYMAPEQNRGKVFPASDVYSLGVVCIRLLTNESPFDLFDIANNCWAWRDRLPAGRRVSRHLSRVLDKMLQDAVSQRYQSADEALNALANPVSIGIPNSSQGVSATKPAQSKPAAGNPTLPSEAGIDYQKLRTLLANGYWQEADEETWAAIRTAVGKLPGSFVFNGDLSRIPCTDFKTIDRLWTKYSRGRFGFSVQSRIYKATEQDYGKFCERVGWQPDNQLDQATQWHFSSSAPPGHLPSRLALGGQHWWRHVAVILAKVAECST